MFFLKLSRNSSRSWDWLGGGSRLFWSLENRSLSDQEVHRVPFVSVGRAMRVSPTLFSENRTSICFRSRSDTASPFKVMISLPFLSPGTRKGKQRRKREGSLRNIPGWKKAAAFKLCAFRGCSVAVFKDSTKVYVEATSNKTNFSSPRLGLEGIVRKGDNLRAIQTKCSSMCLMLNALGSSFLVSLSVCLNGSHSLSPPSIEYAWMLSICMYILRLPFNTHTHTFYVCMCIFNYTIKFTVFKILEETVFLTKLQEENFTSQTACHSFELRENRDTLPYRPSPYAKPSGRTSLINIRLRRWCSSTCAVTANPSNKNRRFRHKSKFSILINFSTLISSIFSNIYSHEYNMLRKSKLQWFWKHK